MTNLFIILGFIIIFLVVVFLILRHKKKVEYLQKLSANYKEPIKNFFDELNGLQQNYVSEPQENIFINKWKYLFLDLIKFNIPKKHEMSNKKYQSKRYSSYLIHKEIRTRNDRTYSRQARHTC